MPPRHRQSNMPETTSEQTLQINSICERNVEKGVTNGLERTKGSTIEEPKITSAYFIDLRTWTPTQKTRSIF